MRGRRMHSMLSRGLGASAGRGSLERNALPHGRASTEKPQAGLRAGSPPRVAAPHTGTHSLTVAPHNRSLWSRLVGTERTPLRSRLITAPSGHGSLERNAL